MELVHADYYENIRDMEDAGGLRVAKSFKRKFKAIHKIIYLQYLKSRLHHRKQLIGTTATEKTHRLKRTRQAVRWRVPRPVLPCRRGRAGRAGRKRFWRCRVDSFRKKGVCP
jgi:hypothetical protein